MAHLLPLFPSVSTLPPYDPEAQPIPAAGPVVLSTNHALLSDLSMVCTLLIQGSDQTNVPEKPSLTPFAGVLLSHFCPIDLFYFLHSTYLFEIHQFMCLLALFPKSRQAP